MSVRFGIVKTATDETQMKHGREGKNQSVRHSVFLAWLEKARLLSCPCFQPQLLETQLRRHAALGSTVQIAFHDQIRLINLFDRVRLLAHGHSKRVDAP